MAKNRHTSPVIELMFKKEVYYLVTKPLQVCWQIQFHLPYFSYILSIPLLCFVSRSEASPKLTANFQVDIYNRRILLTPKFYIFIFNNLALFRHTLAQLKRPLTEHRDVFKAWNYLGAFPLFQNCARLMKITLEIFLK